MCPMSEKCCGETARTSACATTHGRLGVTQEAGSATRAREHPASIAAFDNRSPAYLE
jgi:hypothetical protein